MASLPRTAKPGDEWTQNELDAYRIEVEQRDAGSFFGTEALPEPDSRPDFLTVRSRSGSPDLDKALDTLLWRMEEVIRPTEEGGSVVDLVDDLLEMMHFTGHKLYLARWEALTFLIGGVVQTAHMDVAILNDEGVYMFVQEDKVVADEARVTAEARLVAAAIAAYQRDTAQTGSRREMGFPGIVMAGTCPIFYKIPVTNDLNMAVRIASYPKAATVVEKFEPPVSRPGRKALLELDDRRVIARCFEALKLHVVKPFLAAYDPPMSL